MKTFLGLLLITLTALTSCEYEKFPVPPPPAPIDSTVVIKFSTDIQPIFTSYCISCHSGGQKPKLTSGNSYNSLFANNEIDTNNAASSYLYIKMTQDPPPAGSVMPMSGALSTTVTNKVLLWIQQGAKNN